jgi:chaperonin GroES
LLLDADGSREIYLLRFAGSKAGPRDSVRLPVMAEDIKHAIRMTADRLLVVPSSEVEERKSRSGIVIPATASSDRRLGWAEVVAVGPTVRNVEEGDLVLFALDTGYEVDIRGEEYLLLRERDVHAVASSRDEGQTGLYL